MNILQVRPVFEPGGASKYIFGLSEGLTQQGHKLILACSQGVFPEPICSTTKIYKDISLSPSTVHNLIRSVTQLRQVVQRENIQLIHSHHRFASWASKLVARSAGVPLVSTVHEIKRDQRYLSRWGMGKYIIAVSEAVKAHLVQYYGFPPQSIHVVKMGLSLQSKEVTLPVETLKGKLGIDPSSLVIGCIGRLAPEKGQKYLVQAIPAILQQFPLAYFAFVGDGQDRQFLEGLAVDLGISHRVLFLGWREEIDQMIDLMDIAVMPSTDFPQAEGLPLVSLEILAKKKALIATDSGGLREVVKPMQTGVLVHQESSIELQESIVRLLKDPELRRSLGETGYQLVKEDFSVNQMMVQTERVYQIAQGHH